MKAKRYLALALALFMGLAVVAYVTWPPSPESKAQPANPVPPSEAVQALRGRVATLKARVEEERAEADTLVAQYFSAAAPRLDNLSTPAADLLRGLPFVERVDVALRARRPACRVIQIRDYRWMPLEAFRSKVLAPRDRGRSVEEIELLYQEFLLKVELVQLQQAAALRCLALHHGLRVVHVERLTPEQLPEFSKRVEALKEADSRQAELWQEVADAHKLLREMDAKGQTGTERYAKVRAVAEEAAKRFQQHQRDLVELGAAPRLLVGGELQRVLPLDNAKLLQAMDPKRDSGPTWNRIFAPIFREAWMAKTLADAGPMAVAILGGAHDLTEPLGALGGVEYLRVTMRAMGDVD
jgi:hypothetical protein